MITQCSHCGGRAQHAPCRVARAARLFCSRECQFANRAVQGTAIPSSERLPDGIDAHGVDWRTIPSFPDYQASNSGSIRRSAAGRSNAVKIGKLMRTKVVNGYLFVTLLRESRPYTRSAHSMVCEAFHGAKPSVKHQAAHWDGIKANNAPGNLRWATGKENSEDQIRHGTQVRGESAGAAKFTEQQISAIRASYPNKSQQQLADSYGTSQSHIGRIVRREVWAHLP